MILCQKTKFDQKNRVLTAIKIVFIDVSGDEYDDCEEDE